MSQLMHDPDQPPSPDIVTEDLGAAHLVILSLANVLGPNTQLTTTSNGTETHLTIEAESSAA